MNTAKIDDKTVSPKRSDLYRTIWRWHFYAGLFCIPFILTLAVSGSIYLFKPQIDSWVDKPYMNLSTNGPRASAQQQIDAALAALPNATFTQYRLSQRDTEAVVITLSNQGEQHLVYIHPYTLETLKIVPRDGQFIRIVRSFHGELLLGNVGSIFVELAGCWAIVMIITGLYLWWPRNNVKGLAGVLYPRLRSGGRTFWRDIHAVIGIWISFFTLFLLISGLPWALVWGSAFKEIRSLGKEPVQQSWQVSSQHAEHTHNNSMTSPTPISDELIDLAESLNFAAPVYISRDRDDKNNWRISSRHQNRPLRADAWVDIQSNTLLRQSTFDQKSGVDKAISVGIAAHEGQLFGWLNQLLGLVTSIGLIIISASGFILWRKRKPVGTLGAPPAFANKRAGKTVILITFTLALFLPLLAISIILLWVIENTLIKRSPVIREWLGLAS